jgi:hypothetical protein
MAGGKEYAQQGKLGAFTMDYAAYAIVLGLVVVAALWVISCIYRLFKRWSSPSGDIFEDIADAVVFLVKCVVFALIVVAAIGLLQWWALLIFGPLVGSREGKG